MIKAYFEIVVVKQKVVHYYFLPYQKVIKALEFITYSYTFITFLTFY